MADIITISSNTVTLNATANDCFSAKLVRVINTANTPAVVTLGSNATVNVGTVVVGGNAVLYIKKLPTDLLYSNGSTTAVQGSKTGFWG